VEENVHGQTNFLEKGLLALQWRVVGRDAILRNRHGPTRVIRKHEGERNGK